MFEIKGFIETSLIDWDGMITAVIFLPRCNLACPMCHNYGLVKNPEKYESAPFEKIECYLKANRDFIDGVVVTGGEPTIYKHLPELCKKLKDLGMLVKLDTNGTMPDIIEKLYSEGLIDYVAMDVKTSLEQDKYDLVCGIEGVDLDGIKRTIDFLLHSGIDYEFRTTVVPTIMELGDVVKAASCIAGAKKYVIQQFKPENAWDKRLKGVRPYFAKELLGAAEECRKYVGTVAVRGI
ncbi:MAG: anaerobic ribonucleoside-triphosphate reductase activating protein [Thermoplasmata archaeon HGW-Thermoplasmata-1]|nr:MAG: anaerobic ribonucleoside-triphosphate reductase activating protein [Thermoplasmata archaeon HGW-Thermoplasmata-1]